MLVYDDVITRITVFCILFLLDDAQHQRNQTDTSDKHQQRYQQFTGIAQLRRQIQADPTVLRAETHSKVSASKEAFGSSMLNMKMKRNNTPSDMTTVALERRIES